MHFVAPPSTDLIAQGKEELAVHIKKLSRHLNKSGHSLALPPYIREIRDAARKPIKTDFFATFAMPLSVDTELVAVESDVSHFSSVSHSSSLRESVSTILTEIRSISQRTSKLESLVVPNNDNPVVMIRHKGGRADSVLDGFGSVASASQTAPSTMPPPPSPALPPGVPSSSGVSASAFSSTAPSVVQQGVKRELGSDAMGKTGIKARRVMSVTEFREGKDVSVRVGDRDVKTLKGSLVKGTVSFGGGSGVGGAKGSSGFGLDSGVAGGSWGEGLGRERTVEQPSGRDVVDDDFEEGELRDELEDRDRDGEGVDRPRQEPAELELPGCSLESMEGVEWGLWTTLKPPYSLTYHNGVTKAVYNANNDVLIPIEDVRLATMDDGSRMFQARKERPSFKIKGVPQVFGTRYDKSKASQFFGTFRSLFPVAPAEVGELWMQNWDSAVQVPSGLLKKPDLPFTLDSATKNFQYLASGVSVQRPVVSPTVVPYIEEHKDIVACLPCCKFLPSQCALDLGVSFDSIVALNKDLLVNEYHKRLQLLSVICSFSSQVSSLVVAKELNSPSAFESGVKNLVGGFSGTSNFLCESLMREFSEARIALRKSAFKDPAEHYSARMIKAAPFSKRLFDQEERGKIELEFGRMPKPLHWENFLKLKPKIQAKASKPKPASSNSWKNRGRGSYSRGRGGSSSFSQSGGSFRGKGGPFKSGGGNNQAQGQKFRDNQEHSRGRGGRRN